MIDPFPSGRGGCCLLRLVGLIQEGVEVAPSIISPSVRHRRRAVRGGAARGFTREDSGDKLPYEIVHLRSIGRRTTYCFPYKARELCSSSIPARLSLPCCFRCFNCSMVTRYFLLTYQMQRRGSSRVAVTPWAINSRTTPGVQSVIVCSWVGVSESGGAGWGGT